MRWKNLKTNPLLRRGNTGLDRVDEEEEKNEQDVLLRERDEGQRRIRRLDSSRWRHLKRREERIKKNEIVHKRIDRRTTSTKLFRKRVPQSVRFRGRENVDLEYVKLLNRANNSKKPTNEEEYEVPEFNPPKLTHEKQAEKEAFLASLPIFDAVKKKTSAELNQKERLLLCTSAVDVTKALTDLVLREKLEKQYDFNKISSCTYCCGNSFRGNKKWCPFHGQEVLKSKLPTYPPIGAKAPKHEDDDSDYTDLRILKHESSENLDASTWAQQSSTVSYLGQVRDGVDRNSIATDSIATQEGMIGPLLSEFSSDLYSESQQDSFFVSFSEYKQNLDATSEAWVTGKEHQHPRESLGDKVMLPEASIEQAMESVNLDDNDDIEGILGI